MSRALSVVRTSNPPPRPMRVIAKKPAKWMALSAPVLPLETDQRMRAQSLLTGLRFRDGSRSPDLLTIDQAQDVLRWATARIF